MNKKAWTMRRTSPKEAFDTAKLVHWEATKINYQIGIAFSLRTMAVVLLFDHQYQKSIPYLQEAKNIFLEHELHKATSSCYRNIGNIYTQIGVLDKARSNYQMALEFAEKSRDLRAVCYVRVNLALIEQLEDNYEKAISLLFEALKPLEASGDQFALAEVFFNIGNNYLAAGKYTESEHYLLKALAKSEEIEYLKGISQVNAVLGSLYSKKGDNYKALEFMHHSLASALEMNEKRIASETYKELSQVYKKMGNFQKALECLEQYDEMNQKLQEVDNRSLIESLQVEIDSEKHEKVIYESRVKDLEAAYQVIKEKNKDITDSIKYARHIQESLLPSEAYLSKFLKDYFVFYQPKEIVSGDYYWFEQKDGLIYLAAVDCTGHGVPGAFISIVSSNCLGQSLREKSYSDAGEMLDRVHELFNLMIRQKYEDSTVKDGMDISLCIIDPKNRTVSFSGANHDLHLVRNGEMIEYKGTKQAIGIFIGETMKSFENHHIHLKEGDVIYMFTDGYADQFGGPDGEQKYFRRRLKKFLLSISASDLKQQDQKLRADFQQWKGSQEQVDDVLVIGFKI